MRRVLQVVAILCTLIVGAASLALIVSQTAWFKDWLRGFIVRQADDYVNGRLTIGRIGLKVVVVQGTDWLHDLSQGPGHYSNTRFPGQGTTVAIAGHRTTFGAWFRNINDIRDGDWITLQMPYATFHYRVQYHQVVPNDDWKIIRREAKLQWHTGPFPRPALGPAPYPRQSHESRA